jgi:multidrug efflux pump subunit AcrB
MADESTKKASSASPAVLAMDHPITTLMLVVGLISLGLLAYKEMQVNIFPSMNVPKIYVFFDFIGMSPDQIEGSDRGIHRQ